MYARKTTGFFFKLGKNDKRDKRSCFFNNKFLTSLCLFRAEEREFKRLLFYIVVVFSLMMISRGISIVIMVISSLSLDDVGNLIE